MKCGPIVFPLLLAFICTFSEGKSCTGQILPQILMAADNTESVKSCIKRGGKCCSLSKDGDFVTWDGGKDTKESCDMCWTGKSRTDIYEKMEWFFEKIVPALSNGGVIALGMGKMWDMGKASDMWKDWSGTKKQ